MHRKKNSYFLVTWDGKKRTWTALGTDYYKALVKYGQLLPTEIEPGHTFGHLAKEYLKTEFHKLSPATQESYTLALNNLVKAFGKAPVKAIRASDIGRYMDLRSSKHSANREKAVMSKILNLGVRWGWCDENVTKKISYHPSERRKRIITQEEFEAIRQASTSDLIPVFMDLAFVTGLRVKDLLTMTWLQVRDDGLYVKQSKNSVEGLYELTPTLTWVLSRARRLHGRSGKVRSLLKPTTTIIHKRNLDPYTYYGFRSIWRTTVQRAFPKHNENDPPPDIHIHDIRRTAITTAKQTGIRPVDFSLHKTESEANAYVIEIPKVRPLDLL